MRRLALCVWPLHITIKSLIKHGTKKLSEIGEVKKEREFMRGGNTEEGNQIFYIKGDSLFSNGYKW